MYLWTVTFKGAAGRNDETFGFLADALPEVLDYLKTWGDGGSWAPRVIRVERSSLTVFVVEKKRKRINRP